MILASLLSGCRTTKTTDPVRAATEQLLLSTATDHALKNANLVAFAGRKIFLDSTYFESYDSKYVLGTIRDALSRAGAVLADSMSNSDIIIEARSGALSTDNSESLFGLPSFGLPVPLAGTLQTPQLAFYLSDNQKSIAKIALLAFTRQSRKHVYSSGPLDGKSHDIRSRFLFVSWERTDIPEKQISQEEATARQTWYPKFGDTNLPTSEVSNATPSLHANLPARFDFSTNSPSNGTNAKAR